ncbi:MAG: TetR/AcrR family transcriptional regulator [Oscillospiraceae bacterium]|nr:TetR/AcrR family transcriptional regulator [Oscillospiraceae bacterium]
MSEKVKRNLEITKNALLNATARLMMNCDDANEVTSRAIAKESGVNLAMINYCFGSREGLLYEVFKKILNDVQASDPEFVELISSELSPKQKLVELHFKMMKLMISNYSYSKAITKYILFNRDSDVGMESLPFIAEHYSGRKTYNECRLIAFELTGMHELAVLNYEKIKDCCDIDLTDDEVLKNYILRNVNRFLD